MFGCFLFLCSIFVCLFVFDSCIGYTDCAADRVWRVSVSAVQNEAFHQ